MMFEELMEEHGIEIKSSDCALESAKKVYAAMMSEVDSREQEIIKEQNLTDEVEETLGDLKPLLSKGITGVSKNVTDRLLEILTKIDKRCASRKY